MLTKRKKQAEFAAYKKHGKVIIKYRQQFDAYIEGLPYNDFTVVIKKRKGKPKTVEQLGYYYAVMLPLIKQELISLNGGDTIVTQVGIYLEEVVIDTDFTDRFIKRRCARLDEDGLISMAIAGDKRQIYDKRTMSKYDCMMFLDNVINWCAGHMGLVIPPPEKGYEYE